MPMRCWLATSLFFPISSSLLPPLPPPNRTPLPRCVLALPSSFLSPVKKSSRGSSCATDSDDVHRDSLAYSSSGDFSNCAEFDELTEPRDNSSGLTAAQAAAAKSAKSAAAVAAAAAAGGEDRLVPGGSPFALAAAAHGRRQLGKRELDALKAVRWTTY